MSQSSFPIVAPFRGLRYAADKISDISKVVTPPYDVIDEKGQNAYYDRDPHNMIRIDLNREEGDAKYQSARRTLLGWLESGVLKRDDKPAFYLHDHTFKVGDETHTRKGFFALRRLEAFGEGGIKPHENTLEGPKEDRFKLFKACSAHVSPIFGLYSDPSQEVEAFFEAVRAETPVLDFVAEDGGRHRLWLCSDPIICREVNRVLTHQPIFIADGHHRYETSLRYSALLQEQNSRLVGDETLFYTMMYLTDLADPGLLVLPIHRGVHSLEKFSKDIFIEQLKRYFDVDPMQGFAFSELRRRMQGYVMDYHAYLVSFGPDDFYIIRKRRDQAMECEELLDIDASLRCLDVTVLHSLVFERLLGMTKASQAKQENIDYFKDLDSVQAAIAAGRHQMVVFMNATTVEQMKHVADDGLKMPQKSTFFYPKLLTGLVLNPIVPTERVGDGE